MSLWEYWWHFYLKHDFNIRVEMITGNGYFTSMLIDRLKQIPDEYVIHCLDDTWMVEYVDLNHYFDLAVSLGVDALRLQPQVHRDSIPYRFEWAGDLLKQRKDSELKMSFQISAWRREYFLRCLKPKFNPWVMEMMGAELGDVYFVPDLPVWYIDAMKKGIMRDEARRLIRNLK